MNDNGTILFKILQMKNSPVKQLFFICFLTGIVSLSQAQVWNPNHAIGTVNGVYNFSYNQTPSQLVEIYQAAFPNTGLTYQWESSTTPTAGFTSVAGATASSYTISAPLSATKYYRRKTTYTANGSSIYSNTIKINVVSVNWEDINYIREHDVLKTGNTTWTAVDALVIGDKLQTTTYLDGLGRSLEKISRETATAPSGTWGDMVQFSEYDIYGREVKRYLPYTTTTLSGKYKTTPSTEQTTYYSNAATYNETSPFSTITFDNSPINRVKNIKSPGTSWAAGAGNSADYDMNTVADNIKIFLTNYVQGNAPVLSTYNGGTYPANSLYKMTYTDENGKQVVEFINKSGQLILKKVQLATSPTGPYAGWICTYNVYDEFGLLRFQIQPEGVNYLSNNSWSFAGTNGATILSDQVFQFNYDDKGRTIWKKSPGAAALNMLYDIRDRVVFMQDGNQAALSPAQWTANLYDELDRPILTTLYNTTKTISVLQTDINNAAATASISITNTSNNGGATITINTSLNPVAATDLNNATNTVVVNYQFYDNYSFSRVKTFNTTFTNTNAYSTSDPNVIPIAKSLRTLSIPTGNLTRVLGTTTFLGATQYYDEKGRHIQALEENLKTGTDITTLQYHFDGRLLSTCNDHTTTGTGYTNFQTLTKNIFDKLGRVTSIQKQFSTNGSGFKTISAYDYDDVGRVKTKHLDPGYNNPNSGQPDLESLNFSFNIHNQITGINKDYALKTGTYNKWSHFFGLYLGYDNRDAVFTSPQLNGQVTGQLWNSLGDDAQRRYDYTYDNAGRLTKAAYLEKPHTTDAWANNKMDFTVNGTSGFITYDLNGNLLTMLQKGVLPGTAAPITVDDLRYTYVSLTNKLQKVADLMTNTTVNGAFGDFKDGTNGTNPDYVYDANGNVVIDLNKNAKDLNNVVGANGIHYNFLDKPDQIRIAGKGTINIVYSATGEKLKRTFTPEGTGTTTVTTYINQFVYQSVNGSADALSYINFEEGRIRVITPTTQNNGFDALTVAGNIILPNTTSGVYDYYIMDYQQNVRMILTEETHSAANMCTMETTRAAVEDAIFGQVGAGNEVETTRFAKPAGWTGNTTASVSRLGNTAGKNVGPNVLQKVMAGDNVSATVQYYFQTSSGNDNVNFVNNLLSSLLQGIIGDNATTSLVKGQASNITSQLGALPAFTTAVTPAGSGGTTPRAWLTILFFDERFNFITAADGGLAQQQVASTVTGSGATLGPLTIKAPKNGYVFIYVSNRSDQDVYFDNLNVSIAASNIIEENHYYSYGLKIATISSKKLGDTYEGTLDNKYQMQGSFAEMDDDIGWNDFALRNYDAQIGRWIQQDPFQEFNSPYISMGDDPINTIDPSGGLIESGLFKGATELGKAAAFTIFGACLGTAVDLMSGGDGWKGFLYGAAAGLGADLISSFNVGYLFTTGSTINFFVTQSAGVRSADHHGIGALNADLAWAKTKAFFSLGRLKIISESTGKEAAAKIASICSAKGKTIGSIILESHAHPEIPTGKTDQDICNNYDPATTSLGLGGDDENSRVNASTDLRKVDFFTDLQPYTTPQTRVFLGNCWSGHPAFQPVLVNISNIWNNASVYGHAAECRTSSLFLRNTFYSRNYSGSGDAKAFTFGFHPKFGASRTTCTVQYNEIGNNGHFFKAKDGQVTETSQIYFNRSANISESGLRNF